MKIHAIECDRGNEVKVFYGEEVVRVFLVMAKTERSALAQVKHKLCGKCPSCKARV